MIDIEPYVISTVNKCKRLSLWLWHFWQFIILLLCFNVFIIAVDVTWRDLTVKILCISSVCQTTGWVSVTVVIDDRLIFVLNSIAPA